MISAKTQKTTLPALVAAIQGPTKYRGNLAAGTIAKWTGNAWLPVVWRDDLIAYDADDVRRRALAVLCDFTGDDRQSLLLHNLFVHYWHLDQHQVNVWSCRTATLAKWVEKKMRKLVNTPRYTMTREIADAIERLSTDDPVHWQPLDAMHHPDLQQRRRRQAV